MKQSIYLSEGYVFEYDTQNFQPDAWSYALIQAHAILREAEAALMRAESNKRTAAYVVERLHRAFTQQLTAGGSYRMGDDPELDE
jgi:hypothetical protein